MAFSHILHLANGVKNVALLRCGKGNSGLLLPVKRKISHLSEIRASQQSLLQR